MAIPTWRNVTGPSNASANYLLANAGKQISSGLGDLGNMVQAEDQRRDANQAQAFEQSLSSAIGQFGGDQQQYRDFVTQQVAGNQDLSSAERTATINSQVAEQEALLGLTQDQQLQVSQQKQMAAQTLDDLTFNQKAEKTQLQQEYDFPLEQVEWENDTATTMDAVQNKYAHLGKSGESVQYVHDKLAQMLGKAPSAKEVEGIILNAAHADYSAFNDNSFEITDNVWSKFNKTDLTSVIKKYMKDKNHPTAAKRVRDLNKSQATAKTNLTNKSTQAITQFGNKARKANADVLSGAARSQITF